MSHAAALPLSKTVSIRATLTTLACQVKAIPDGFVCFLPAANAAERLFAADFRILR
jgi:hypothetical protein